MRARAGKDDCSAEFCTRTKDSERGYSACTTTQIVVDFATQILNDTVLLDCDKLQSWQKQIEGFFHVQQQ